MSAPARPSTMMSATPARPAAPPRVQLVAFRVGGASYAVDVFSVERVLRYESPRPIPNVPAWLEGVIDYGGSVVPVIDLRTRFDLPLADDRSNARIVVFVHGDERVAASVDAVDEVATVDEAAMEEPPPIFRGLARQYLRALVRRGDTVTVVLDAAQLLNSRERIVLDQAMAETRNG
ncbi:MAG: chemotaxis protein CheW [Gemmatimonadota bacterium]|nr:chemotaxis protein CheW [Gemmatimonadota bacterium]